MTAHASMKLGRREPDHGRLMALPTFPDYFAALAPPPAEEHRWLQAVASWPMLANDRYGCCTCATVGHVVQGAVAANGGAWTPTEEAVLDLYARAAGFDPTKPDSDRGAVMMDVMDEWRARGIDGHQLGLFAKVRVGDGKAVRQAISMCGAVCVGLGLPDAWRDANGGTWDAVNDAQGGRYGSWGLHEVSAHGYDAVGVSIVTWGEVVTLTWGALAKYGAELLVPITRDWADADGAPSGFAYDQLAADLGAIVRTRVA